MLARIQLFIRALWLLFSAEWLSGIYGLKLFVASVAIASLMMGAVWTVGSGLSTVMTKSGPVFLGGDLSITTTNIPLPQSVSDQFAQLGSLSVVAELRSSAQIAEDRIAVEVKAIDNAYPLYGQLELGSGRSLEDIFFKADASATIIVDETFLTRTQTAIGDIVQLGGYPFEIIDTIILEPDRLSAGQFMVGPRVMLPLEQLLSLDLIQPGSLVDYRYRIKNDAIATSELIVAASALKTEMAWELETPDDAGDRVLRVIDRTTTFLGIAGIMAFAIGLAGAGAAAKSWFQRRTRTIALYRLSGASNGMVAALHGVIMGLGILFGLILGFGASLGLSFPVLDVITNRLHIGWHFSDILPIFLSVIGITILGFIGVVYLVLAAISSLSPGRAMRSGEASFKPNTLSILLGSGIILLAFLLATLSLPFSDLAGLALLGLMVALCLLGLCAFMISQFIARWTPTGLFGHLLQQNLSNGPSVVARTLAVGVGIVGITTVITAQNSLNNGLIEELPEQIPDLILIDIQPDQITDLRNHIGAQPDLGGLQSYPFMRMTIVSINGVAAEEALVRQDKSWVIEGDRSFSYSAEPTGAELLAGTWWDADYDGPPLISPEEDVMEAFDLKVGDVMTYNVLGRDFTSTVTNIRKEYHRTFRPEYLMMASPEPFINAPHTWVASLEGENEEAVINFMRYLAQNYPNITSIDIRELVGQVSGVIRAATFGSIAIAGLMIFGAVLSLIALVASDVDARRKEALIFTLMGISRREVASLRLCEAALSGLIASLIGGLSGLIVGYSLVSLGLRVSWDPGLGGYILPFILGISASVVAGLVGGLGAAPKGKGALIRQLTA